MKPITVVHTRNSNGEVVVVPVLYSTEQENERVTNYHFRIDLAADDVPDWIHPHEFTIREVSSESSPGRPGVTTTLFSEINVKHADMHGFIGEAHTIAHANRKLNG
ncbi:MAG: hypothetical protein K8F30_01730 [Taibaiella sp.]|nr:hypothetical protein [Taibaiella sp.]